MTAEQPPLDLSLLNPTKTVRNFLCDYLYKDDLILSYAPAHEFGSGQAYKWLTGGYVCEYEGVGNTIAPREKVNFRIIRMLWDSGLLKVKRNIRTPHVRCVIFEWTEHVKTSRREILTTKIFTDQMRVNSSMVKAIASQYGLQVRLIEARSIFEVLKGSGRGEPIPAGKAKTTYIFMTRDGQPVSRWRDLNLLGWEDYLFEIATRAKSLKKPLSVPANQQGHLSGLKRA